MQFVSDNAAPPATAGDITASLKNLAGSHSHRARLCGIVYGRLAAVSIVF